MYRPSTPAIAFVGPSGSGKTTLIEGLTRELASRSIRIGVVKHTHHLIDWDQPGKDSWRFRESGASRVVLATPELVMAEVRADGADRIAPLLAGLDLIIHEGGRQSSVDKVLVGESLAQATQKDTRGRVVGVVGGPAVPGLPHFPRDDIGGISSFLAGHLALSPSSDGADFDALLERSVAAHGHMCPGQVLGVRMTMRGLQELGLSVPPPPKRLIAIVETDRCAADAVASVSGCSLGKRTLKHFDFGKMAASFLDTETGAAVRIVARDDARQRVLAYAPESPDIHQAQTQAYRAMPDSELLAVQRIRLRLAESDMPGRPRSRVACSVCGEHVSDERHVFVDGQPACRACAGGRYYGLV